jgi:hypothetical protein
MTKCNFCNEEFVNDKIKANHIRWHHSNQTYSYEGLMRAKEKALLLNEKKFGKWIEEEINCFECGEIKKIRYRQGHKKEKYFCSRICANTRHHSTETKTKISKSNTKGRTLYKKVCPQCKKEYETHLKKQKFCSERCGFNSRVRDKASYNYYRGQCKFKFALQNFPNEFDFSLIRQNGWYYPPNRGNNLSGISRDHMVSVKYGFANKIPPEIISHPANCQLLVAEKNWSKNYKCSMTIDELYERINLWDEKYQSR